MRRVAKLALAGLAMLAGGELAARGLGYGQCERVLRFDPGVGTYADPATAGPEGSDCRLLVVGDSIVDDVRGATSDVAEGIAPAGCAVANVSLGGWGPGDALAYFNRFGWGGASHVLLVVNSDDLTQPGFARRSWRACYKPQNVSALAAMVTKEVLGRVESRFLAPRRGPELGVADLEGLIGAAMAHAPVVQVAWHPRLIDVEGGAEAPARLAELALATGRDVIPLRYAATDYDDRIHLNEAGRAAMVAQLVRIPSGLVAEPNNGP